MAQIGLSDSFNTKQIVNLSAAKQSNIVFYDALWKQDIEKKPKLRTYRTYKDTFAQKSYLFMDIPKNQRSLLVHLRTGILPLRIETGRFLDESEHIRLCIFCDLQTIKNEIIFGLQCTTYNNLRQHIFGDTLQENDCNSMSFSEQLSFLMNNKVRQLSKYIYRLHT